MAIFNAANTTAAAIINNAAGKLLAHREALAKLAAEYSWSAGVSVADLTAAPISMDAGDAATLLSAIADAHAEYLIHTTGQPPASYPQVTGTPYVYATSQDKVIGPLST